MRGNVAPVSPERAHEKGTEARSSAEMRHKPQWRVSWTGMRPSGGWGPTVLPKRAMEYPGGDPRAQATHGVGARTAGGIRRLCGNERSGGIRWPAGAGYCGPTGLQPSAAPGTCGRGLGDQPASQAVPDGFDPRRPLQDRQAAGRDPRDDWDGCRKAPYVRGGTALITASRARLGLVDEFCGEEWLPPGLISRVASVRIRPPQPVSRDSSVGRAATVCVDGIGSKPEPGSKR